MKLIDSDHITDRIVELEAKVEELELQLYHSEELRFGLEFELGELKREITAGR